MPRYYFDVRDGDDVSRDRHGIDLPSVRHVWEIAVPMVDEIAAKRDARPGRTVSVVVRDASVSVVYRSDHHGRDAGEP